MYVLLDVQSSVKVMDLLLDVQCQGNVSYWMSSVKVMCVLLDVQC